MSKGMWSDEQFASLPSLSVAAHELKSPIALMRQLTLLLRDEQLTGVEQGQYSEKLIATADRALRLVVDLSHVASLQEALFPLEPVNPFAVCRELAHESRLISNLYQRQINWPKARPRVLAVANSYLLKRVVMNFLDNALKYTDPETPISVGVKQSGDIIRVSVRDHGPRMARREYQRIVDEMELLKTVRTRPESSGLGIFLASSFARSMSGQIGLMRHRDGVTFFVELPVSRQMSLL